MQLEKARKLKPGNLVGCPADGNQPECMARVTRWNQDLQTQEAKKNIHGDEYIWVELKGTGWRGIWPSNRLK
jgi:hypothetical protein